MGDSFRLKVFTPEGPYLNEAVTAVTVVNADGEIGILPGHARYVSLLGTGILSFTLQEDGKTYRLVASEGFCQMTGEVFSVLADRVLTKDEIPEETIAQRKNALKSELEKANFFDPAWDVKRTELKLLETIERI